MNGNDGILALLQDIKQMLFGCGILLPGIFLSILALFLSPLLPLAGIPVILSGCLRLWNGCTVHAILENKSAKDECKT